MYSLPSSPGTPQHAQIEKKPQKCDTLQAYKNVQNAQFKIYSI